MHRRGLLLSAAVAVTQAADVKVWIVTWCDERAEGYGEETAALTREYAARHGYKFTASSAEAVPSPALNRTGPPHAWERFPLLLETMKAAGTDYSHVLWLDCDAYVKRRAPPLSKFVEEYGPWDLYASQDIDARFSTRRLRKPHELYKVNTGVLLFRVCPENVALLEEWSDDDLMRRRQPDAFPVATKDDQWLVQYYLYANLSGILDATAVVPYGCLQAFRDFDDATPAYVDHCPNRSPQQRVAYFTHVRQPSLNLTQRDLGPPIPPSTALARKCGERVDPAVRNVTRFRHLDPDFELHAQAKRKRFNDFTANHHKDYDSVRTSDRTPDAGKTNNTRHSHNYDADHLFANSYNAGGGHHSSRKQLPWGTLLERSPGEGKTKDSAEE